MHSIKKTLCATVGSAALIVAGAATAGAPGAGFGAWTYTPGVGFQNAAGTGALSDVANPDSCASGFSCGAAIEEGGFFQRSITDNTSGTSYFQTIIVDDLAAVTGAAGDQAFADENFVAQGIGSGIADRQSINDGVASGLIADTTVLEGWALGTGENKFTVFQILDTPPVLGETLFSNFSMSVNGAGDQKIDMTQTLTLNADTQAFEFNKRSGAFLTTSRDAATATPDIFPAGGLDENGVAKSDISWAIGDTLERVAVGQTVTAASQLFGYEAWKSTAAVGGAVDFVKSIDQSSTGPFSDPSLQPPNAPFN